MAKITIQGVGTDIIRVIGAHPAPTFGHSNTLTVSHTLEIHALGEVILVIGESLYIQAQYDKQSKRWGFMVQLPGIDPEADTWTIQSGLTVSTGGWKETLLSVEVPNHLAMVRLLN